ncbi:MAG: MoaD/ThiS family protein [Oscillospiraceae bacterium]|nr:MoaD/ThiS family protein [Oscillospiraceae bacterium]
MMSITVKYRGELSELTGVSAENISAATVSDVLKHIKKSYGADACKSAKRMVIAVNGKSILLLKNEKTALYDGDTVSFLPICGGG